jgi:CRISPR/Cas system-associated exonuclease Cas4 (RecB family)
LRLKAGRLRMWIQMFEHITPTQWLEKRLPTLKRKNENGHRVYYDEKGNRYHSVTNVVGSADRKGLDEWRAKVGDAVADYVSIRSATTGTKTHKMVETYLANVKNTEENIFAKAHFNNIKPLLANIDFINGLETKLCSKELGLAGTVDCLAKYKGVDSIIDFKTSSRKKKDEWIKKYFLQTTAYSLMWEELTGIKVTQIVILISGEDGSRVEYIRDRDEYVEELKEIIEKYNE